MLVLLRCEVPRLSSKSYRVTTRSKFIPGFLLTSKKYLQVLLKEKAKPSSPCTLVHFTISPSAAFPRPHQGAAATITPDQKLETLHAVELLAVTK